MFLYTGIPILQNFACNGLNESFVTWHDCTFVTQYIAAEFHTVTIFSLSPLANLSHNRGTFPSGSQLSLIFFISTTYLQSENLPLPWLLQQAHPKSFASYKHYYCSKFLDTCSVFFWATH